MDSNFTLISQLVQILEHFIFLSLEAAVQQFSTYLLISFDPITLYHLFSKCV